MANPSIGRNNGAPFGVKASANFTAKKPSENDSLEILMNEHEAAARMGLKVATLRRWRWAGCGPNFIKLGNAVRYAPGDLAAFIDAGRRISTSDTGPEAAR